MTLEDYLKQIDFHKEEIKRLTDEALSKAPFQPADKVRVVYRNDGFEDCFVSDVFIDYDKKYNYRFNKIKKDGTMSGLSAGIYSWDTISKI